MTKIRIDQEGAAFTVRVWRNGRMASEELLPTSPDNRSLHDRIKDLAEEHGLAADQVATLRKDLQLEF